MNCPNHEYARRVRTRRGTGRDLRVRAGQLRRIDRREIAEMVGVCQVTVEQLAARTLCRRGSRTDTRIVACPTGSVTPELMRAARLLHRRRADNGNVEFVFGSHETEPPRRLHRAGGAALRADPEDRPTEDNSTRFTSTRRRSDAFSPASAATASRNKHVPERCSGTCRVSISWHTSKDTAGDGACRTRTEAQCSRR